MSHRSLPASTQPLRVLLVEDHPLNQMVVANMLEDLGHAVDVANDGQDALGYLQPADAHYDWVLTDLQMPNMDGFALSRWLRDHAVWHDVRIVGMTANAHAQDWQACANAGMDHLLTKPFEAQALQAVLRPQT